MIKKIILFALFLLHFDGVSQPYYFYQDVKKQSYVATRSFNEKNDTLSLPIGMLPVKIEWRYYPNWNFNRINMKEGLSYLNLKAAEGYTYGILPNLEKIYRKKLGGDIKAEMIKNDFTSVGTRLNENDSIAFIEQMDLIEASLNSDKTKHYILNDTIINILKKCGQNNLLYYSVSFYHGEDVDFLSKTMYCFQRVYLFNIQKKEISFYKFKKRLGGADSRYFWLPLVCDRAKRKYMHDKFPNIKSFIRPYIKFLKVNKKK